MSKYDEVAEVLDETPVFETKPIRDFIWCGVLERRQDRILCFSYRTRDKVSGENERGRCGFLNEGDQCEFITKEEKVIREKAVKEAAEDAKEAANE